jgi:hypothetical protein
MERAQKGHSRPHGTLAQSFTTVFRQWSESGLQYGTMHHLNQYAEAEGAEFRNVYFKDVDSLLAKAEKARILSPSSLVIILKDYSAR